MVLPPEAVPLKYDFLLCAHFSRHFFLLDTHTLPFFSFLFLHVSTNFLLLQCNF